MKKTIMFMCMMICMIATAMAVECDWGNSEVTNCDVTSSVSITGDHYVANVTLYGPATIDMNNVNIYWNESWGYQLHSMGTNLFFALAGDDIVVDGHGTTTISGIVGHEGAGTCDSNYGTTGFEAWGTISRPVIKNINFENNLAPIKYYWDTRDGVIEGNTIEGNSNGERVCHPVIYGTGNYTLVKDNTLGGQIGVFGGRADFIDNTDMHQDDEDCVYQHFSLSNNQAHEGDNKYWYGGQISGNVWSLNSCGGSRFEYYTGDGFNITGNTNINLNREIKGSTGVNEYIYGNTIKQYGAYNSAVLPTFCVGGLSNTYNVIYIPGSGNFDLSDFFCLGVTETDAYVSLEGSDIIFDCGGINLNNQIAIYSDDTIDNVLAQNCDITFSEGPGMEIVSDGSRLTNIAVNNINILSTGDTIYVSSVDGLTIENVVGSDCGGGVTITGASDVAITDSTFERGGCKGYNSLFQDIDGLTITGSTFDTSGSLEWNQESLSFDPSVTNLDFHDNHVIGDAYIAMDASSGMFYSNVLDTPLIWLNPDIDICHGGDSNEYNHNLGFLVGGSGWYEHRDFELDPACNPLTFTGSAYPAAGLVVGANAHIQGNGVNINGPSEGANGITTFMVDFSEANDILVENLNLYNFPVSISVSALSVDNTFRNMIVDYPYIDEGTNTLFENVRVLHPEETSDNSNNAFFVQQNVQKQAQSQKQTTILDAIWQVIANIRKALGFK